MAKKINIWYRCGLWSKKMVQDALRLGIITEAEYEEITGEAMNDDSSGNEEKGTGAD